MTTPTPPSVIITTESKIWGKRVDRICGLVVTEKFVSTNISGNLRNRLDGQPMGGEEALQDIRAQAEALGADAVVKVKMNYEHLIGLPGSMMVMVSGTAVKLEEPSDSDEIPF